MPDALFVYGSLRSEFDNPYARLLRGNTESRGHATVRGSIFRIGKYPGYRGEPDGIVRGELWHLHNPEATLAALDDYEGAEYSRVEVEVRPLLLSRGAGSAAGPSVTAWIYLYTGEVSADRRIQTGDFLTP